MEHAGLRGLVQIAHALEAAAHALLAAGNVRRGLGLASPADRLDINGVVLLQRLIHVLALGRRLDEALLLQRRNLLAVSTRKKKEEEEEEEEQEKERRKKKGSKKEEKWKKWRGGVQKR